MPDVQPALVTFKTFSSHSEASLAKSLLDAFDIECFTSSDDCGGQRPPFTLTSGVRLVIREEDRERAGEIFAAVPAEG